jgi:phosphomannomutase/phosphomannomutase/phosphoglucomutase
MKMNSVIFREYDIRGVFDVDYDLDFSRRLARAYAVYSSETRPHPRPTIAIGYDARLSSPAIAAAVTTGLCESGFDVAQLGLVTSPMTYFSTFAFPAITGAIMITGSHNPPEYNGFKICVGNSSVFGDGIRRLHEILRSGRFLDGNGSSRSFDMRALYVQRFADEFKELPSLPVVFDCGNATAGSILPDLVRATGLNAHILFPEPDGTFPNHHPDPTVEENLRDLKAEVRKRKALVGIGFDGDSDRIGVVDDQGRTILGDDLMTIYARSILSQSPGVKVVGDVKCSDRFFADVESRGGVPVMWKTGHSLVKEKIRTEGAPFGGELSGHVFFADRNYGYDDAIYAGFRLIEILARTRQTISELLSDMPAAFATPEIRIDTTEDKKVKIVQALKDAFAHRRDVHTNLLDGLRVSYSHGWALARASNTQPVLVLRFESKTASGLSDIRNEFESIVKPLL